MPKPTAEQQASAELAAAVFADPALRANFELMAKDTGSREPVPDDFSWLPPEITGTPASEFSRFLSLTRRLLGVPKAEIDARRRSG